MSMMSAAPTGGPTATSGPDDLILGLPLRLTSSLTSVMIARPWHRHLLDLGTDGLTPYSTGRVSHHS